MESLLDIAHAFLDFAFYLPHCAFHLLVQIASDFSNLLLHFASNILDAAFNLVLVHLTLREAVQIRHLKCELQPATAYVSCSPCALDKRQSMSSWPTTL